MKRLHTLFAEAIGTYCLVFAGTGAIVVNDISDQCVTHVGVALTFGLIVMVVIYAIGEISGAHINPAVSVGFWVANRFEGRQLVPYIAAQCVGAVLASGTLRLLFPEHQNLGSTLPAGSWTQAFLMELILTLILMFVILRVSRNSKETGIMAGAAIGATVALEALFAGPITGASMNPARSLGPALVSGTLTHLWIYVVATTLGAGLAVLLDMLVEPDSDELESSDAELGE